LGFEKSWKKQKNYNLRFPQFKYKSTIIFLYQTSWHFQYRMDNDVQPNFSKHPYTKCRNGTATAPNLRYPAILRGPVRMASGKILPPVIDFSQQVNDSCALLLKEMRSLSALRRFRPSTFTPFSTWVDAVLMTRTSAQHLTADLRIAAHRRRDFAAQQLRPELHVLF